VGTYYEEQMSTNVPDSLASGVRRRIMALVLCSTLAVALAFGLSFYFALVSNQSAVARQIPELAEVAAKLKSLLIVNTVIFVAIIIASFAVLARIVTARMFQPLGLLHRQLTAIASGTLPRAVERSGDAVFTGIEDAMETAIAVIRDRERAELEKLSRGREAIASQGAASQARATIEEVIASKSAFLGMNAAELSPKTKKGAGFPDDSLFIKPR